MVTFVSYVFLTEFFFTSSYHGETSAKTFTKLFIFIPITIFIVDFGSMALSLNYTSLQMYKNPSIFIHSFSLIKLFLVQFSWKVEPQVVIRKFIVL